MRVKTAIHLSICEFESSGSRNFPIECLNDYMDINSYENCIHALESSPQWWTTYSGNYQNLPQLCFENALPFEKEQILELFLNITDLYSDFQSAIQTHWLAFNTNLGTQAENSLNMLKHLFDDYLVEFTKTKKDHEHQMQHEFTSMKSEFQSDISALTEIVHEVDADILNDVTQLRISILSALKNTEETLFEQLANQKKGAIQTTHEIAGLLSELAIQQKDLMGDIDGIFEGIIKSSMHKNYVIQDELLKAQEETVEVIHEFNGLVYNSIIPALSDSILPRIDQLSSKIVENMETVSINFSAQLHMWLHTLDDTFNELDERTNNSLSNIKYLEKDMTDLNKVLDNSIGGLKRIIIILEILLRKPILIGITLQLIFRRYLTSQMYLYGISILVISYLGSMLGSLIHANIKP